MTKAFSRAAALAGIATTLTLAGCGRPMPKPPNPTPTVQVMTVATSSVPNVIEVPGRIEPVRTAEVRARVDGIVERRLYEEGRDVRAGTPLFLIDPRDKRAQVSQAKATLARALAAQSNAAAIFRRYEPLVERKAVSAQEFDTARANLADATASVADARAALDRAKIQLEYTVVRAPIAGRAGRALVTEGALVTAAEGTQLTTVNQLSPVYAVFTESAAGLTAALERSRSGETGMKVTLLLESGQEYPVSGRLDFADLAVDPSTGSQTLRATFANPDRRLLPGQFVRARIHAGTIGDAIRVPARAVQIEGEKARVMLIGKNGVPAVRAVQLGAQDGNGWIVNAGLRAGERLVVDGWQKAKPGQKVNIKMIATGPAGAAR